MLGDFAQPQTPGSNRRSRQVEGRQAGGHEAREEELAGGAELVILDIEVVPLLMDRSDLISGNTFQLLWRALRNILAEDVNTDPPEIGKHVARDLIGNVAESGPQRARSRLAVCLEERPARRKAEWLLRDGQQRFERGFDLAKVKKFLYRPAVLGGEGVAMSPVEDSGLLEWGRTVVVQEITKVMPVVVRENQDFVTGSGRFARLDENDTLYYDARSFAYRRHAK